MVGPALGVLQRLAGVAWRGVATARMQSEAASNVSRCAGYFRLHKITQMDQDLSYFDRRIMLQYINKMLKSYLLMMERLGKLDLDLL